MGSLCSKEEEDEKLELSENQRVRISAIFSSLDEDEDGYLVFEEFGPKMKMRIAHQLGHQPDEEQISQLFSQADANDDGKMDLEEFISLITTNMGPPKNVELHDAFDIFDKDQDGVISKEDLHNAFASVGDEYITINLCEEIICRVDKNTDSVLTFSEFKKMWKEYLAQSGGEIPFLLVDENPRRYSALAAHPEATTKKNLEELKTNEVDTYEESEYQKMTQDTTDGGKDHDITLE